MPITATLWFTPLMIRLQRYVDLRLLADATALRVFTAATQDAARVRERERCHAAV